MWQRVPTTVMGTRQLRRCHLVVCRQHLLSKPGRTCVSGVEPQRFSSPPFEITFWISTGLVESPSRLPTTNRFIVQKHLHGFVQDDGGGDTPGGLVGDAQRRGNLDIVGLQFDGTQGERKLSPKASAQVRQADDSLSLHSLR